MADELPVGSGDDAGSGAGIGSSSDPGGGAAAGRAVVSPPVATAAPASMTEMFFAFNNLALHGFGGVLPWAQRVLVDRKRWLSQDDFVEMLAFGQLFPGPNVINLCIMVGDRFFGWRGALVSVVGLLLFPSLLVLGMAFVYAGVADLPAVRNALDGMSAVAAGLIMGTAWKLARSQKKYWRWLAFGVASFVLVGVMRWPLLWALALLAPVAIGLAWRVKAR